MSERLATECDVLCRWILGRPPAPEVVERYVDAHRHLGSRVDAVDAAVSLARRGVRAAGLADAWSRVFRPTSPLRRKASLLVAILECRPDTGEAFEAPERGRARSAVLVAGVGRGLGFLARATLGAVAVGACGLLDRRRRGRGG